MFRIVPRFLGIVALAGAFAALIVDGTRSVAAGAPVILPLGRALETVAPKAFVAAHVAIEAHVPLLWDPVLVTILLLPSWVVLGLVGLVLLTLGRRPTPKIGYSRR